MGPYKIFENTDENTLGSFNSYSYKLTVVFDNNGVLERSSAKGWRPYFLTRTSSSARNMHCSHQLALLYVDL